MSKKPVVVGIDLGTTNSALARMSNSDRPEMVPNAEGKRTTPSVVQIQPGGIALVGEMAKHELVLEKENTAHFFKRDMGTDTTYEFHGHEYTPVDFSAAVLEKLKKDAEEEIGLPRKSAVLTVPAYFHDEARVATKSAGEHAGLEVLQIINEPTAAAIAYGLKETTTDEFALVFDLGGGTFDVSLVRIAPDAIEVIGTDGNHTLGGKDWDDRLVQHVCEEFRQRHGVDPLDDLYSFQEILLRAEEAKKALSSRNKTVVAVSCGGRMDRIEVTRQEFESLTADLLTQTEILVNKLLEETRFELSKIGNILMVGGSTRMPMCSELVERMTGRPPNTSLHLDECVAMGAVVQASAFLQEQDGPSGLVLQGRKTRIADVMSHSMGMIAINRSGDRYINSVLIPRNNPVPCSEVRPYQVRTSLGGEGTSSIFVTQGEGEDLANCSFVGKFLVMEIPHTGSGKAVLDISYNYDRSGVINVTAIESSTGKMLLVEKQPVPEDMDWIYDSPKQDSLVHKTVYLAVDLSGSMSGRPLDEAKRAVITFVEKSDLTHTSVGLIVFSDLARVDQVAVQDGACLARAVKAWEIGGDLGGGNDAQPFEDALKHLKDIQGPRYVVVLTDGVWYDQPEAIRWAKVCHEHGIEIIAIGFGDADEGFLKQIATSEEAALHTGDGNFVPAFGQIAQVLLEGDGDLTSVGLALRNNT